MAELPKGDITGPLIDLSSTKEFKEFIRSLLTKYCRINDKHLNRFTDAESMKIFRLAFIHPSMNGTVTDVALRTTLGNDYNKLEYLGDGHLHGILKEYLADRYPDIVNEEWLTKIEHYLASGKIGSTIANELGFGKHIQFGKQAMDLIEAHRASKQPERTDPIYYKALEDTFEAFLGALNRVIVSKKLMRGTAFEIQSTLVTSVLDAVDITINEVVFDSKSLLKNLYDKMRWYAPGRNGKINDNIEVVQMPSGKFLAKVYGYVFGDKTYKAENRRFIAEGSDLTYEEAVQNAAAQALKVLDKSHNLSIPLPNPKQSKNWQPPRLKQQK